jgi:phosphoglycerate kinase
MKSIEKINFKGSRVLIRVDFNVPLNSDLKIIDDGRIIAALPTIKKVMLDGGKVIILSHLGRPKNSFENCFSLKHLVPRLSALLNKAVIYSPDCIGKNVLETTYKMKNSDVLILENLRFYKEEKKGDYNFAKQLSKLGDFYINDAFGTSHRDHASTSIIARFFPKKKFAGYLLNSEISTLKNIVKKPKRPLTAIIGGAKISGKIDVITSLYDFVDNLIIGGGMAYTFIKAMGGDIGNSIFEKESLPIANTILEEVEKRTVNLILPVDSVNAVSIKNNATSNISNIKEIPKNYIGLDIGPKSILLFSNIISNSKTIIWNGPMGVFEYDAFSLGTKKVADAICLCTNNGGFSLVGGGDSVAAIKKFNLTKKISYLSTGGGAMLKYLEGGDLAGVNALDC